MTVDGRPYYQNTITKKTSWLPPDGWIEPGKAASTEAETTVAAAHGSFFKSGGTAVDVKGLGVEVEAAEAAAAVAVAPTPIGRVAGGKLLYHCLVLGGGVLGFWERTGFACGCGGVGRTGVRRQ